MPEHLIKYCWQKAGLSNSPVENDIDEQIHEDTCISFGLPDASADDAFEIIENIIDNDTDPEESDDDCMIVEDASGEEMITLEEIPLPACFHGEKTKKQTKIEKFFTKK